MLACPGLVPNDFVGAASNSMSEELKVSVITGNFALIDQWVGNCDVNQSSQNIEEAKIID